jgi:AraC family transcriptional regulator of adaptative response / DNA-3-methyladenine glycosylase II
MNPLELDRDDCYAALCSHDTRFDGRIFIGCKTTGIYCRPVCRVKTPRLENCDFFASAAAAEAQNFRPCLKCRPELAPGEAPIDSRARIAKRAALIIEEDERAANNIAYLAKLMQISERQLRRIFEGEYGVSPVQYLQTRKLLLAKNLLTDTQLPITGVALTAGFKSVRRFNELFKERYRLAPRDFRKDSAGSSKKLECVADPLNVTDPLKSITVLLGYRPPYRWQNILEFLAGRIIGGVEFVADGSYRRTVRVLGDGDSLHTGWIEVSHADKKSALAVTVSAGLLPVLAKVLARVRYLFDLNANPAVIDRALAVMNEHKTGLYVEGTRVPGCFDPFEMTVRAILGQQVTVKAAQTFARRIASTFGEPIATPFAELNYLVPSAHSIAALSAPIEDKLGPLGVTGARARCIYTLAQSIEDGSLQLSLSADPLEQMAKLLALPGFGPWTVNYVAMRALGWPDAFPHTDYGVKKALEPLDAKEVLALSEAWKPWRSYATINLWNSLATIHNA